MTIALAEGSENNHLRAAVLVVEVCAAFENNCATILYVFFQSEGASLQQANYCTNDHHGIVDCKQPFGLHTIFFLFAQHYSQFTNTFHNIFTSKKNNRNETQHH